MDPQNQNPALAALHQQWLDAHARLIETSDAARAVLQALADGEPVDVDVAGSVRLAQDAQDAAARWLYLNGQYLAARRVA